MASTRSASTARPYGAAIFDVMYDKPPMLVPRSLTAEVSERVDFRGEVLRPLDEEALRTTLRALARQQPASIAVCLLFSFLCPQHEERVGAIIAEELPECSISLSSAVLPQIREYYRLCTTVINAYLQPILERYIANLDRRLAAAGVATAQKYIMQSNGGMSTFAAASQRAATTVLSGPAGGVTAGVAAGRALGIPDVITFDMGGTSCDVALIRGGQPLVSARGKIEGHDIAVPMMDINTVSAGGGTIAASERPRRDRSRAAQRRCDAGPRLLRPWRTADHHGLQSRARLSLCRQFPRRPHAARCRARAQRDRNESRGARSACRSRRRPRA